MGLWVELIGLLFGILISSLQVVIVLYLKSVNRKVDEVCHRVYHHKHDDHGNVVIPCNDPV